jgi:hypothetical protein
MSMILFDSEDARGTLLIARSATHFIVGTTHDAKLNPTDKHAARHSGARKNAE